VARLQGELQKLERDEATFTAYESKATALAKEIKVRAGVGAGCE
jgi:hypothetical protein